MTARAEVRAALAVMVLDVAFAVPSVAAQDCSIGRDGWDDIGRFRRCLEEYNPDRSAVTPLHHAAEHTTNPQVLEALLAVGADPNAKTTLGTPLHIAIDRCRQLLVRVLLEYGADPNATRGLDQTPLEVAESCSNASERDNIVRMLREAGAREP